MKVQNPLSRHTAQKSEAPANVTQAARGGNQVPSPVKADPKGRTKVSFSLLVRSVVINRTRIQILLRVRKYRAARETRLSAQKTIRPNTVRELNRQKASFMRGRLFGLRKLEFAARIGTCHRNAALLLRV